MSELINVPKLKRLNDGLNVYTLNGVNYNWDVIEKFLLGLTGVIEDKGIELLSSEGIKEVINQWLANNEFKPKDPVESFNDLPVPAELKEIRGVLDENAVYVFDGAKWVKQTEINYDGLSDIKKLQELVSFKRYGILDKSLLPFNLGFNLYRGTDGRITHDYVFEQHTQGAVNIYVSRQYGVESNDGLSKEKPVQYLKTALDLAHARSEKNVNIVFLEKMVYYALYASGSTNNTYNISKNINLLSDHEDGSYIYSGNFPNNYIWSNDGGVYKTTRSAVAEAFDSKFKDFRGNPKKLTKVDTLEECKSRFNSYYTDNVSVWVHRQDNSNPADDNAIMLLLPINTAFVFNLTKCTLFIDNVHFYTKQASAASNALLINGDDSSDIIIRRSSFCYSRNNGLGAKTFNKIYIFDSYSEGVGYDAFNFHANAISANPTEKVFLYNCYAHNTGSLANNNGNAFTAHDGMKVVGVNLIGHDTRGPVLADVNGCESVYFDSIMYNSLALEGATKSAFYADESQALKKGSFTLISCSGGGKDTYSVNNDGKISTYLMDFNADTMPETFNYTMIE